MYRASRGTQDILPQEQDYWRYVQRTAEELCRRFGYQRIDTPVFESADLFVRGVGDATDIVIKEMYTFEDRGGEQLTLRPEGTAPVCRAYLERGMASLPQPVRLHYFCPIFRYERPQAGRYRQHHQFGIEAIGDAGPAIDAEVIQLGWLLVATLGLKGASLKVNTIGDPSCRPTYLQELRSYYQARLASLCPDCQARYHRNPLRLLDCKQQTCQPHILEAPRSADHLCPDCQRHWTSLQQYLEELDLPFQVEPRLVRGLDYYARTVFEVQPQEEGSQSTLVGGGRYDGLIQALGGRPTPGIGFGAGLERLVLNLRSQQVPVPAVIPRPVVVAHQGKEADPRGAQVATQLRQHGISVLVAPSSRSLRAQMRYASSMNARFVVILGEAELARGVLTVRDMDQAHQQELTLEQATSLLSLAAGPATGQ
ncbi:MAG: histidine--tRNA ligase [Chloroflexi bacterium]|nr:histidine--tRNA ligase [Chloroflexota bacterium]